MGQAGRLGRGLATRLSKSHDVLIGSRNESKGLEIAEKVRLATGSEVIGGTNEAVARICELAILTIPYQSDFGLLRPLKVSLGGKIIVSPVVPIRIENGIARYAGAGRSAAEEIASTLDGRRIVAALHNVPARTLEAPSNRCDFDVLVACDRKDDYGQVGALIGSIDGLRALYAGPLAMSREIEALTPLLLNAAKLNGLKSLSMKLVN